MTLSDPGVWTLIAALVCAVLLLFHRPILWLLKLLLRSSVGLALLAVLKTVGPSLGISLGVNPANALVLGLLGVPGFGLLLMLQWVLR